MEPKWARFLVRNAQLSTRGFTDDIYAGTSVDDASMYFLALQHHFYGRVIHGQRDFVVCQILP